MLPVRVCTHQDDDWKLRAELVRVRKPQAGAEAVCPPPGSWSFRCKMRTSNQGVKSSRAGMNSHLAVLVTWAI